MSRVARPRTSDECWYVFRSRIGYAPDREEGAAMSEELGEERIRPIRALLRGLEALECLNRCDGLTVSEVASEARLPRTTAYRVLETLCVGGFVVRDEEDDRYRPTLRVRGLADGFVDDAWIREVARPEMERTGRTILWPLMLSTVAGGALILRVVTDRMSPLALAHYAPGERLGLATSPAGMMRLACASEAERTALLDLARAQGASKADLDVARKGAAEAAARGYALDLRSVAGEAGVSTPVRDAEGRLRAVLCMRFIRSALEPEKVIGDFVPALRASSARIGAAIPVDARASASVSEVGRAAGKPAERRTEA